ncbi:GIY-YIG nuclease family protein [Candidatus Pacearchaeota archaeon]|nr:GIY-YIG nuclease family protein [Candidatus Pacearchaeota archaeon]
MKKHYIYIARCNDDTLYTGYTTDLKRREEEHNEGGGARYTRSRRPVKIVYSETFKTRSLATKREYEIKQLKREVKEGLIKLR